VTKLTLNAPDGDQPEPFALSYPLAIWYPFSVASPPSTSRRERSERDTRKRLVAPDSLETPMPEDD
jgi:hypothetical protein